MHLLLLLFYFLTLTNPIQTLNYICSYTDSQAYYVFELPWFPVNGT